MANCEQSSFSFWQFSDELRSQTRALEDQQWSQAASKLALVEKMRGLMLDPRLRKNPSPHSALTAAMNELEPSKNIDGNRIEKLSPARNSKNKQKPGDGLLNMKPYPNSSNSNGKNGENGQKNGLNPSSNGKEKNKNKSVNSGTVGQTQENGVPLDKRFKSLPLSESLPRDETLGGYIFVCNNDTMQEDLRRQLFGLPQRYRDSVRAIRPGLPLFLYNYTTHQLHGVYEAAGFGGTNIDPTAWEDKKCKGESRFPAQVCIRIRSQCKSLEEDCFRPNLHHYDGPKFRLQLSVPETLSLLDLFGERGSSL